MSPVAATVLNYLLNALWQVPLLFVCGWLASRLLRPLGPVAQHRVWSLTFLLEALLPACSLSPFISLATLARWLHSTSTPRGATVTAVLGPGTAAAALHLSARLLSGVVLLYSLFLAAVLARFLWRALALSALRRSAVALPLSPASARFFRHCGTHFAVRGVTIAASARISGPVTFGLRCPLILLPGATLPSLSETDLHTILAHEFAHLHRQDFLKNVLYELLSLPVSFHPVLWLTRTRLTETREIVCDQLGAALTSRREYARSLLHLASLLLVEPPLTAPHAIGILDAHAFERRLMHLTGKHATVHGLRRVLPLAAGTALALTACTTALALRVDVHSEHAANGRPTSQPPARISSSVMAGNLLTHVNPTYPQAARDAKIQGTVVLRAVISKDGTVEKLTVVSGPEELRAPSLDAVRQWTYKPYVLNGDPTPVDTTVTVNYSLEP